jgi:hypothetical protein
VPKRNIHATATVRQLSDDVMQVQGYVFGGLLRQQARTGDELGIGSGLASHRFNLR